MRCKALKYKDSDQFVRIIEDELFSSSLPELMPMTATMELIEQYMDKLDLSNIQLVELEVTVIEINKTNDNG